MTNTITAKLEWRENEHNHLSRFQHDLLINGRRVGMVEEFGNGHWHPYFMDFSKLASTPCESMDAAKAVVESEARAWLSPLTNEPVGVTTREEWEDAQTEITRLTSQLEQAREIISPFADAARSFTVAIAPDGIDDGLTVGARIAVIPDYEAVLSTYHFSRASQWIKDRQAKGEGEAS